MQPVDSPVAAAPSRFKASIQATDSASSATSTEHHPLAVHLHGVDDRSLVDPDASTHDHALVSRAGNDEVPLALFRDYAFRPRPAGVTAGTACTRTKSSNFIGPILGRRASPRSGSGGVCRSVVRKQREGGVAGPLPSAAADAVPLVPAAGPGVTSAPCESRGASVHDTAAPSRAGSPRASTTWEATGRC